MRGAEPNVITLAEAGRLFCPLFSSVASIHEIDVTLVLSVYTHAQQGQMVNSSNKNKRVSILEVMSPVLEPFSGKSKLLRWF